MKSRQSHASAIKKTGKSVDGAQARTVLRQDFVTRLYRSKLQIDDRLHSRIRYASKSGNNSMVLKHRVVYYTEGREAASGTKPHRD